MSATARPTSYTVLQHRVAALDVGECDLVSERHRVQCFYPDRLVGFHDPSGQFFVRLYVFHDGNADGVSLVVHDEISRHFLVGSWGW